MNSMKQDSQEKALIPCQEIIRVGKSLTLVGEWTSGLLIWNWRTIAELWTPHGWNFNFRRQLNDWELTEDFEEVSVQSRGFGILDVGYRSQGPGKGPTTSVCCTQSYLAFLSKAISKDEAWAAGGSGILLKTTNGGKTWIRDKAADNIAANLYSVKFINDNQGFVLGNDGVLLKLVKEQFWKQIVETEKLRGRGRGRGHDDQEINPVPGVTHSSNKKRKDEKRETITCFRCGGKGHYLRDFRALKHLVDLYQASLKKKERNPEDNFLSENNVDTHA
ncbi:Photosystem II stability/assembly factor, chloroplastic [Capsicum annuum]|nr:Photosystem II stability/assembly factor, chloroplastic [Capsicum annuum]